MSYTNYLNKHNSLKVEYSRFLIKLLFSVAVVLLLGFLGFMFTFILLVVLLILGSLFYKIFKNSNNKVVKYIFGLEREYEQGIAKKEALLSLLAFITTFALLYMASYFLVFPLEWALIIGFVVLGVGNNYTSFLLYFKKSQYRIYGTTIEFFLVSILLNTVILTIIGMPVLVGLYIASAIAIIYLVPWIDHNLTTPLLVAVLYLLLFI